MKVMKNMKGYWENPLNLHVLHGLHGEGFSCSPRQIRPCPTSYALTMPRAPGPSGPEEVGSLYDRLASSLYRYALMIVANPAEAEDVIQQVFVALVKRGTTGLDSAEHYLRRAVRNESYSALRRCGRGLIDGVDSVALEAFAGDVDRPDERIAIERALASLPADQREVVHLKVFEGLTFQEIADLAGESINTIASRYRYAMEKLRRTL